MRLDGTQEPMEVLREIAESLADPVFLVDVNFNVWYHNRAFERQVGVRMSSRRYEGMPCHQLLGLEVCSTDCVMRRSVQYKKEVRLAEVAAQTAGGEARRFNVHAIPVFGTRDTAMGALMFLRDITEEAEVQRKYKALVTRNSAISLSGRIEQGNLPDVLQLFAFLQKTGHLSLQQGGEVGEIVFERGKMIAIHVGAVAGEKAIGRLMTWVDAGFSFHPQETVDVEVRLSKSSDFVLMEALREKDELAAAAADIPPMDARPRPIVGVTPPADLDALSTELLASCERDLTIGEIVDGSLEPDARVVLALIALRDKGLVAW